MADDLQSLGGRKSTATSTALRPPEQGIKCPRCDSPNTKFCYYNNYSLHQPRHFCKTCRRYWTKGGALRNVPVGGGCRKNKKSKSMASSRLPLDPISGLPETSSSLKFLNGMPSSMPMDFQIGLSPVSRLHAPSAASRVFNSNQLINFRDISPDATFSSDATPAVGFNYPISGAGMYNEIGGTSSSAVNNSSIVSSIESLSSINQDLHWKLQQQRLAMLFGGEAHKESNISRLPTRPLENQQELLSSEVAERPIDEVCVGSGSRNAYVSTGTSSSTAWFLGSSYTMPPPTSIINSSSSNVYGNANNGAKSSTNFNTSYWNGVSAWNDTPQQFTALP